MATLVLTAVGTAIGGPLGGAIGGLIGNAVDHGVLFKPKGREGSRLSDLHLQTSTYGTQLPKLFGTMRVAGTVIWATDLIETSNRSGGGKGQPSVTSYAYSCSFAVALSSRPIRAVRRIWADGNLLRGAAGDFKTDIGGFRMHDGNEDQPVDPLIASALGTGHTPAHRGIAYALFEDLALGDYGNRIPSLTFEVEADDGPVTVGLIAAEASGGAVSGPDDPMLGFAVAGSDVGEALAPMVDAFGLGLAVGDGGLQLLPAADEAEGVVAHEALCTRVNGRALVARERADAAADTVPASLAVRYYDPARDYQAGVQRASRPGPGRVEGGIELPAAVTSEAALGLATRHLRRGWSGRARTTLHGDWTLLAHPVGQVVRIGDEPTLWRVENREWADMAVRIGLRRVPGAAAALPAAAMPGAIVQESDAPHGATSLMLADLPRLTDGVATRPAIVAAASGGTGWRRAALYAIGADEEATPIGRTARRAVMGTLLAPAGAGSITLLDARGSLMVGLLAPDMDLMPASEAMLAQGRNLCLIGSELLQFAQADRLDGTTFRLSGLRRGLRGTDWATAHEAGEPFLLIDQDRLADPLEAIGAGGEVGSVLRIAAIGIGDLEPVEATLPIVGEALIPPAPVHLTARPTGGGLDVSWVRRSRAGWAWTSGGDVPLAEEAERYAIAVLDGGVPVRGAETTEAAWTYEAAMIADDIAAGHGGALTLAVRQIGSAALGRAAQVAISI
ncbi:MAG: phage tail protein [Sphingobium sp.]